MAKDMTKAQFKEACRRRGFIPCKFVGGYYDVGRGVHVYAKNAGQMRRQQLAYLIRQSTKQYGDLKTKTSSDTTTTNQGAPQCQVL